jgi:hypothetical protein
MVLLICVETVPFRVIPRLAETIAMRSNGYQPVTRETWLVGANHGPNEWMKWLRPLLKKDDSLLIIEVTQTYGGWGAQPIWNWLNSAAESGFLTLGTTLFEGE